jgi:hypothetical protein
MFMPAYFVGFVMYVGAHCQKVFMLGSADLLL